MNHSQSDPVLSVRETENATASLSGGASERAALLAGVAARDLLATRTLEEGEVVAIRALLDATGLAWGAIYRPAEDQYRLSRAVEKDGAKLPHALETNLLLTSIDGVRRVGGCGDEDLGPRLRGSALLVRLDTEFDAHPAVLILASQPGEARPAVSLRTAEAIAEVCSLGLKNLELVERLRSEVFVDFLTHCYNRRAFEEHLTIELVRAKRYERPLCLLLLDLDEFKEINDVLGHQAGDYVLQKVSETLRAAFRTTDRVCRFGGDEFAVIFPETPKEEVLRLAERLRRQVSTLFPDATIPSAVTPSIGVASYPRDAGRLEDLVRAADQALYKAKEAGRNKVVPA